jgi:hypothetical protein
MKSELEKLLSDHFMQIDFRIILTNTFAIGSMFKFKDTLPKCLRSSVVYKFSCALCASEYVGSTSRTLKTRVAEHAGRSCRTGALLTHPSHSSIRTHAERCDVPVNEKSFTILDSCSNVFSLRILESLYIFKHRPALNDMQSSVPLRITSL